MFSSGCVSGTIDTQRLEGGKHANALIPTSIHNQHSALREYVITEAGAYHGAERVVWLGETLRGELQLLANAICEGRLERAMAVRLLGGLPSEQGADDDAQISYFSGMGRYGDESSKEDTRRGLHRLEVLVGRVHGLAGGAVINPQELFGLTGSDPSVDGGLLAQSDPPLPGVRAENDRHCLHKVQAAVFRAPPWTTHGTAQPDCVRG